MSPAAANPSISVVLPAYNAAAYVGDTVRTLLSFFEKERIAGEVIVVDDGSTDATAEAVPRHPCVQAVRLPHNRGKGGAIRAGMQHASGNVRIFTDADLPYGTEPILVARRAIEESGFHAVVGDRTLPGSSYRHEGLARRAASEVASFAFRTLVTGGIYDTQCGFKAFRGQVAEELFRIARIDGFATDVELIYLLLKYRLDIKRIPVQLRYNAGSTVQVLRDSTRAGRDILVMRMNWARGRYRTEGLAKVLEQEVAALSGANMTMGLVEQAPASGSVAPSHQIAQPRARNSRSR